MSRRLRRVRRIPAQHSGRPLIMTADRRRKSRRVSADRRMTGERETMLAIVIQQWGEPSVLEPREVEVTEP